MAIRDASDYLNDNIPEGSMIVILNIQSDSAVLSEYIIDELIANAVHDKIFKVVDRQQLDLIRTEQNFQLSGEVDDNLALSIGKFFGAQTIVSGRVRQMDDRFRLTIRALEVQTAQVQGQYNRNIAAGKTIIALIKGGSGGVSQTSITRTTGSGNSATGVTGSTASRTGPAITDISISPNTVSVDKGKQQQFSATVTGTNNPDLSVTWTVTNNTSGKTIIDDDGVLTVGSDENITPLIVTATSKTDKSKTASATVAVPGGIEALNVNNAATWNTAINKIRNGGNNQSYVINVTGNVPVAVVSENLFGSVINLTVTFQGGGTLSISNTNGNLIRIGTLQTVIAKNITLRGRSENNASVVRIESGGTFRMEGATITGNKASGGGVYVNGGTFTMLNGTISGNTSGYWESGGGGVFVNGGRFTMQGGTISGNTSTNHDGGGVYISSGTFIMQGGTISGNTTRDNFYGGGGVYISGGTFTMQGGTISNNTTSNNGGGVYISGANFTMQGGTISNNTSSRDGGGVYIVSVKLSSKNVPREEFFPVLRG